MGTKNRHWLWLLLFTFLLLSAFVTWAVIQLPTWARNKATIELSKLLERPVTLASIDFGLWPLRAGVKDFRILEMQGSVATFAVSSLQAEIDWASVIKKYPIVTSLKITNPVISLTRYVNEKNERR
jgi:hypothetical protein